jgi:hypothetical protein
MDCKRTLVGIVSTMMAAGVLAAAASPVVYHDLYPQTVGDNAAVELVTSSGPDSVVYHDL